MREGKKGSRMGEAVTKAKTPPQNGKQSGSAGTEESGALLAIMPDRREMRLGTSMGHRGPVDKKQLLLRH